MRRREFITLIGGAAAAAWPFAARAQQTGMPVIGFLGSTSPEAYDLRLRAFRQGLKETGHVEGQNVAIEYRWSGGQNDRLPALAAELVQRKVSVITASGTPSALAAKNATANIPIVFGVAVDPVKEGFVASLNRPDGNLTGVTNPNVEVGPKRLELLHELLPAATVVGVLVNPNNPSLAEAFLQRLQTAAHALAIQLHVVHAGTEADFDTAFAALLRLQARALVIMPDQFFNERSEQLARLTVRHAMPAVYQYRPFVAAGGLLSYGTDDAGYYRLVGVYTGRILKGEKPSDLPVQQLIKVEMIINLKTAKALSITVPLALLGRADEVIE